MQDLIDWKQIVFLSGNGNCELGEKILRQLSEYTGKGLKFGHINFARFGDRESDNKIPNYKELAGRVVVFYQSVYTPELLAELEELVWAIKHQYKATYVVVVAPFLPFRRQDHPEKLDEINRNLMLVETLKYKGVDCLIVASPHSSLLADNCQKVGILFGEADPSRIFFNTLETILPPPEENRTRVYAPDQGAIGRAINVAELLKVEVIFHLKERGLNNLTKIVEADQDMIQQIKDKYRGFSRLYYADAEHINNAAIVMVDDEISSGSTANNTGRLLKQNGAEQIYLAATHAVCVDGWKRKLFDNNPFDKVIITDTIYRGNKDRTGGLMHDVSMHGPLASELYRKLRFIYQNCL